MDSSLSLILADIVMQDLEEIALALTPVLPFYIRYIGNIIFAAPEKSLEKNLNKF